MVSISEVHFNQRAMIEFHVAENESVGSIHKQQKNGNSAFSRSTVVLTDANEGRWHREMWVNSIVTDITFEVILSTSLIFYYCMVSNYSA
jgi:hypothetical protein